MRVVARMMCDLDDMQWKHCFQEFRIIFTARRLEVDTPGVACNKDTLPRKADARDIAQLVAGRNRLEFGRK